MLHMWKSVCVWLSELMSTSRTMTDDYINYPSAGLNKHTGNLYVRCFWRFIMCFARWWKNYIDPLLNNGLFTSLHLSDKFSNQLLFGLQLFIIILRVSIVPKLPTPNYLTIWWWISTVNHLSSYICCFKLKYHLLNVLKIPVFHLTGRIWTTVILKK